ncbi:MAG: hypothetical protein ACFFDI_30815 [Promethearchaeota archaeon]
MGLDLDKVIHYRCLTPIQIYYIEDRINLYCPMCEMVIEEIVVDAKTPASDFNHENRQRVQVHLWVAIPAYVIRILTILGNLPLIRRLRRRSVTHSETEPMTPIIIE